jgi:chromosome segregation ATPase
MQVRSLSASQTSESRLDARLAAKRAELRALDDAIAERKAWHRDQELLIAETVEHGNMELTALNYEVTAARQMLKDLKTAIRTYRQDKTMLEGDLQAIQVKIVKISSHYSPLSAMLP